MRGFHCARISVVPGSNTASAMSSPITRWIDAPKLKRSALPRVARCTRTGSVEAR